MTADDGTQDRTIAAISREMAVQGITDGEMARRLGLGASQWSNVKAGRQVLAPWMLRRISIRLGSAAAVVEDIVFATGESVTRDLAEPCRDARSAALDVTLSAAQLAAALHAAATDGRFDTAEGRDLLATISTLGIALDGLAARVATGRVA